jgi:hypothetical protein
VGALFAAIWTPNLVSLFVGTWVDRLPSKRRMLIIANLIQAAGIVCVPIAHVAGALSMPVLYGAAIIGGLGGVLFHTAYPPFFVHLVNREQYVEANSLLSTTRSASYIAGPPLAGALIRFLTAPVALVVDACSFLLSALMISRVTVDEHPAGIAHQETYRRRLKLGVNYLRRHPYLRATLTCSTTLNFFALMVQAVLVLYASRTLDLGAGSIGLAFGIGATGGVVGAAIAGRLGRFLGTGRTIATGAILSAIPLPGRDHRNSRVHLRTRHHALRHQQQQRPNRRDRRHDALPRLRRLRNRQLRNPPLRSIPRRLDRRTHRNPLNDRDRFHRRGPGIRLAAQVSRYPHLPGRRPSSTPRAPVVTPTSTVLSCRDARRRVIPPRPALTSSRC